MFLIIYIFYYIYMMEFGLVEKHTYPVNGEKIYIH